jgi:hypothetical protein
MLGDYALGDAIGQLAFLPREHHSPVHEHRPANAFYFHGITSKGGFVASDSTELVEVSAERQRMPPLLYGTW